MAEILITLEQERCLAVEAQSLIGLIATASWICQNSRGCMFVEMNEAIAV
ncbi:MAG: hypothetical protein AAF329_26700 [Cyanobacteria bacterium P01_A01_bin.17]